MFRNRYLFTSNKVTVTDQNNYEQQGAVVETGEVAERCKMKRFEGDEQV